MASYPTHSASLLLKVDEKGLGKKGESLCADMLTGLSEEECYGINETTDIITFFSFISSF